MCNEKDKKPTKYFKIEVIKPNEVTDFNKDNLDLADKSSNSKSKYNSDHNLFEVKFPVPNMNYRPYQIFTIDNKIWVFISDKTNNSARQGAHKKFFIMTLYFSMEDIITPDLTTLNIPINKEIETIIYNDNRISEKWKRTSKLVDKSIMQPNEKGGGVIIKNP